jgi:hypothetical protein
VLYLYVRAADPTFFFFSGDIIKPMVSIKKVISYLLFWSFSLAFMPATNNLRQEYDTYLQVFKKKESPDSFDIFKHNYYQIVDKENHYLTQDSDNAYNEYFSTPAIYIYKMKSRQPQNQKILLCV